MADPVARHIPAPPLQGICPACNGPAPTSPRYPVAVCDTCVDLAICALPEHAGRVVSIGSPEKFYAGPMRPGHYGEDGQWSPCSGGSGQLSSGWVIVRGVDCWIAEAHFGGTVVVPR